MNTQAKKNLAAMLFGILSSIVLVLFLEYLAKLNESENWILPTQPEISKVPQVSTERLNLPPLDLIIAETRAPDYSDADDYSAAYKDFGCFANNSNTWWVGKKNCSSSVVLRKVSSGRVVYNAKYSFDEHALRIVPNADRSTTKVAMFLGCSFTFGEGVQDSETFANLISKMASPLNAYILATPGIGPHNLLHILDNPKDPRLPNIYSDNGVAVYTLLDDHIERAFNSSSWLRHSPHSVNEPYYDLVGGKFQYIGSFSKERKFNFIYLLLAKSHLANLLHINLPFKIQSLYERYAAMFERMKELTRERFGIKDFVVSVYPENTQAMPEELQQELTKRGIIVINLAGFPANNLTKNTDRIFGNGHPSAVGHNVYSAVLYRELHDRNLL